MVIISPQQAYFMSPPRSTTMMSPGSSRSMTLWTTAESRPRHCTVMAVPETVTFCCTGLMPWFMIPASTWCPMPAGVIARYFSIRLGAIRCTPSTMRNMKTPFAGTGRPDRRPPASGRRFAAGLLGRLYLGPAILVVLHRIAGIENEVRLGQLVLRREDRAVARDLGRQQRLRLLHHAGYGGERGDLCRHLRLQKVIEELVGAVGVGRI